MNKEISANYPSPFMLYESCGHFRLLENELATEELEEGEWTAPAKREVCVNKITLVNSTKRYFCRPSGGRNKDFLYCRLKLRAKRVKKSEILSVGVLM